jgi:hypothetical protein
MAYVIAGKKVKRAETVLAKVLVAGARSVRFTPRGDLEVEWESGTVLYEATPSGLDVRFDPQLDYDLKGG